MTWFKFYFKSRTCEFSNLHVTKNYLLRFKKDLCHALTVTGEIISTFDIINSCLQQWSNTIIPCNWLQDNRQGIIIPLSKERLDMTAYTFMYLMKNGWALEKDWFWEDKHIWELLLKYRFQEHSACHKASCFKKGCECRFLFPFMLTTSTYIH